MKFEKVFLFVCWLFVAYLVAITVTSCSESDEQLEDLSAFNPTWKEIFKTTMFNSKIN